MPSRIKVDFELYDQSLGVLVKELIKVASTIYNQLLLETNRIGPISLVCGGQSPAYFALAMYNLSSYNDERVSIVILPHSKGGDKKYNPSEISDYCSKLKAIGLQLRPVVYILDTVHSGVGIQALENCLYHFQPSSSYRKISINHPSAPPSIRVFYQYTAKAVPRLSDSFPRIVHRYHPFEYNTVLFKDHFINLEKNEYAAMIIEMASLENMEESEWFKLNC